MTAQEKAKELLEKFSKRIGTYNNDLVLILAKSCAIQCIDEMLDLSNDIEDDSIRDPEAPEGHYKEWVHATDYLIKVKEELEKL